MKDSPYKLSRVSGVPVSDEELLADLKRVAALIASGSLSESAYRLNGKFHGRTISRRFGSWNKALELAGLATVNEVNISDEVLYENLLNLWQHFGRQPRRRELAASPSTISQSPYLRRFGSWTHALESFINFANTSETSVPNVDRTLTKSPTTGRDPSVRLRYQVLKRDHFSCRQCGASPAKSVEVELHVDHITPWSKGGLTTLENLRTLCQSCNLGKSNLL